MKTLKDLIDASMQESTKGTVDNDIVQEAVTRIVSQRRENAVSTVQEMISIHESRRTFQVTLLKEIRGKEAAQAKVVKKLDRAFRFFQATANPFPLFLAENPNAKKQDAGVRSFCNSVGLQVPDEDSDAWDIPKDWQPPQ